MLSMASTYKWTPWKSLLLDAPTQHHHLIHASGVFDLLRDYIAYQEFQVLMGTHDVIQAKFFQRKLENENIDVEPLNDSCFRKAYRTIMFDFVIPFMIMI